MNNAQIYRRLTTLPIQAFARSGITEMRVLAASEFTGNRFWQIFRKLLQAYEKYCKLCSILWYKVLYELIYSLVQKPTSN